MTAPVQQAGQPKQRTPPIRRYLKIFGVVLLGFFALVGVVGLSSVAFFYYIGIRAKAAERVNLTVLRQERSFADFPADLDWSIKTRDGQMIPVESFRGQVIFLNAWATWCKPCRDEMPNIAALYKSLQDVPDIAFLVVSDEEAQAVIGMMNDRGWDVPSYVTDEFPEMFENGGRRPMTAIIDPQGIVRELILGSRDWDTEEARDYLLRLSRDSG